MALPNPDEPGPGGTAVRPPPAARPEGESSDPTRYVVIGPDEWRRSPAGDADEIGRALLEEARQSDPAALERARRAAAALPRVGGEVLGFHLIAEIGRGSFARVFLAQQPDLADRLVALKVSVDLGVEPEHLARLQHTNIMPIHSVHRGESYQALCMPYFGPATLETVVQSL